MPRRSASASHLQPLRLRESGIQEAIVPSSAPPVAGAVSQPKSVKKPIPRDRVRAPNFDRIALKTEEELEWQRGIARKRGHEPPRRAEAKTKWLDAIGVQRASAPSNDCQAATLAATLASEKQWVEALMERCAYSAELGRLQQGRATSP
jgi:hypothetical protein